MRVFKLVKTKETNSKGLRGFWFTDHKGNTRGDLHSSLSEFRDHLGIVLMQHDDSWRFETRRCYSNEAFVLEKVINEIAKFPCFFFCDLKPNCLCFQHRVANFD
mmetsp:Transcript_67637/g.153051  ORF Transcript_67637/g.153051 Transcript_67637/m.153051 type:complete len:104 (-) Transcript_67637:356-667(-)